MKRINGIYKITNKINNKIYIGKSFDVARRIKEHANGNGGTGTLNNAIREFGWENFSVEIFSYVGVLDLCEKELEFMLKENSIEPNGYNNVYSSSTYVYNYSARPHEDTERGLCSSCGKKLPDARHNLCQDCYADKQRLNTPDKLELSKNMKKMSRKDLAERYGVSVSLISKWIVQNNLSEVSRSPRGKREPKLSKEKLEQMYNDYSVSEISDKLAVNQTTVYRWLKHYGLGTDNRIKINNRPEPKELADLIIKMGFSGVARMFNVDATVPREWCKSYKMPHRLHGLIEWRNNLER